MEPTRERVFVYGTLRRGGSRAAETFYPGVNFVGPARVRGHLHDLGAYPGLRLDPAAGWVAGEILELSSDALAGFDEWEGVDPRTGVGEEYSRRRVSVTRADGDAEECWVYEIAAARAAGKPVIASGSWLEKP